MFTCDLCSREFTTKSGRTNHRKTCLKRKINETTAVVNEDPAVAKNDQGDAQQHTEPENNQQPQAPPLPQPPPAPLPAARIWGSHTREDLNQIVAAIYEEIVHWRKNIFLVPSGAAGKKYVRETTRMVEFFNCNSKVFGEISMKLLMIMPALLLQKPSFKSRSKIHSECLARRLLKWELGEFDGLMIEGRTIQKKMKEDQHHASQMNNLPRRFTHLMLKGQTTSAMKLLNSADSSGVLSLSDDVIKVLKTKHPDGVKADETVLLSGEVPFVDPVMFHDLDETVICKAAIRTKGAAGPSGMDAENWKRIIISKNFGQESASLRSALAKMARKMCIEEVVPEGAPQDNILETYIACRLIPLDKNPGVRPIGIGETIRRIIGKSILQVIRKEVVESAGSLQLCAGQPGGCEAAVHAVNEIFNEDRTDGVLLIDASNAFNSLNRQAMLNNIRYICPPLATYIRNCYIAPSRLFVTGGKEIKSSEGTTQGDPHAMPVYAVGITPLLPVHNDISLDPGTKQVAYADDLCGAGRLTSLHNWWLQITKKGPLLGYHPNAEKSWLVVKPGQLDEARKIFKDSGVKITSDGRKYLGGFIGSQTGRREYVNNLIEKWSSQLLTLSEIAKTEPHSAFTGFSIGFRHKLTYHMRAIPDLGELLESLDHIIDHSFIPAITGGHVCSNEERRLLSLPIKFGGLSLPILKNLSAEQHQDSKKACQNLTRNIIAQERMYKLDRVAEGKIKKEIVKRKEVSQKELLEEVKSKLSSERREVLASR